MGEGGICTEDAVAHEAGGAAGEGPAEVAGPGVQIQARNPGGAEDRSAGGAHRPQAGPGLHGVRVEILGKPRQGAPALGEHVGGTGGVQAQVSAGEFRGAGQSQPAIQRGQDHLVLVVDDRQSRLPFFGQGQGQGIALDRRHRQAQPEAPDQGGCREAAGEHHRIRRHGTGGGLHPVDPSLEQAPPRDPGIRPPAHARALRRRGQLPGEGGGIADGVVGEEQRPAEAVGDRRQGGLLGGDPRIVPFLEANADPRHRRTRGAVPGKAVRVLEDLQDARFREAEVQLKRLLQGPQLA
jgi:hypothetical protein